VYENNLFIAFRFTASLRNAGLNGDFNIACEWLQNLILILTLGNFKQKRVCMMP
jgi:hypothetical protein